MNIILMGVSGCGKTSIGKILARKTGKKFLDGDDYHPPENIRKMQAGEPLNDDDRKPWLQELMRLLDEAGKGKGCILACSALKQSYRDMLSGSSGSEVVFVYLKGSRDLIAKRLNARVGHYFPKNLLESQFSDLEEPSDTLTIEIDLDPESIADRIIRMLNIREVRN
jgi:gluconokinase